MNILTNIRRNWLWLTLCLLLSTIETTRMVPAIGFKLSWWYACLFPVIILVTAFAGGTNWFIFRPLRWLTWINTKDYMEKKFKAIKDNPMVYPAILWLELGDAERAYIVGGMTGFQKAFNEQCARLKEGFTNLAETLAGPKTTKAAGCCDGNCGCNDKAI